MMLPITRVTGSDKRQKNQADSDIPLFIIEVHEVIDCSVSIYLFAHVNDSMH